jgi:hypothetical protein
VGNPKKVKKIKKKSKNVKKCQKRGFVSKVLPKIKFFDQKGPFFDQKMTIFGDFMAISQLN